MIFWQVFLEHDRQYHLFPILLQLRYCCACWLAQACKTGEWVYNESIAMRYQGKPVNRWWFVRRRKQIIDELEPDHNFLFWNHWFERFQNRYNISLRRKTHCSQKPPTALEPAIKKFTLLCCDWEILVTLKHLMSQILIRRLYHLC